MGEYDRIFVRTGGCMFAEEIAFETHIVRFFALQSFHVYHQLHRVQHSVGESQIERADRIGTGATTVLSGHSVRQFHQFDEIFYNRFS